MGKIREDEFIDQEVRDYVVDILSLPENFVAASYSVEAGKSLIPFRITLKFPQNGV